MRDADMKEFRKLLDATCKLLSKGAYVPDVDNTMVFFRALQVYPMEAVRAAMSAHVADPDRGRFVPVPADLVRQINAAAANDGRPSADEAWAVAVRAADESDTVVWTTEIQTAWGMSKPIFDRCDEIGARMAFRETYNRLVAAARSNGVPAAWSVSEGFDPAKRIRALELAERAQQLPHDRVVALLPPPESKGLAALLENPDIPQHARDAIKRFKDVVAAKALAPGLDAVEKQRTTELKAETTDKVNAYRGQEP